ncbi:MAG: hypothetical protein EBU26_18670, partial [Verrucomicrobia bacterium]|nr:hypothetical protein [Verrucomicrobiota bacterium]
MISGSSSTLCHDLKRHWFAAWIICLIGLTPCLSQTDSTPPPTHDPMDLAWDSQNHQLWIAGGNSGCLLALDPKSETLRSVFRLPTPLRRIKAITATGEILALEPARGLLHFVTSKHDAGSPSSEHLLVGEHVVDFSLS